MTHSDPPCETCGGRLVEAVLEACEHERKRRGVCRYCPEPVAGQRLQALYCARHRKLVTRAIARAHGRRARKANPRKYADAARERYWRDPEAHRARKRERRAS